MYSTEAPVTTIYCGTKVQIFWSLIRAVIPCFLVWPLLLSTSYAMKMEKKEAIGGQPSLESPNKRSEQLYKSSHALLISVSSYGRGWNQLEQTAPDMDRAADALRRHGFATWRVSEPTGIELLQVFREFVAQHGQDKESRLVFFFSGHGYTDSDNNKGYLVPIDAKDPTVFKSQFLGTAIRIEEIVQLSTAIKSKHALLVFDSCFSGSAFFTKGDPNPIVGTREPSARFRYLREQAPFPVRQMITAGRANEVVPATGDFVSLFLRGLAGEAAPSKDTYVTGSDIGKWLVHNMPTYATQHPQYGVIQNIEYSNGDMIFQLLRSDLSRLEQFEVREAANATSGVREAANSTRIKSMENNPLLRRTADQRDIDDRIAQEAHSNLSLKFGDGYIRVQAYNGTALLIGQVKSERDREAAESLVRSVKGTRRVINEIQFVSVPSPGRVSDKVRNEFGEGYRDTMDALIVSSVRYKLWLSIIYDGEVFKVDVENGVVYLLGLCTEAELESAKQVVLENKLVRRVVDLTEKPTAPLPKIRA